MHDPLWMNAILGIHIVAGAGSFLIAPLVLAVAKGGKTHRRWGMVYLWCMGLVAATALPMAFYRPVLFLALVAIFSFYMAFSGYRVLKLKNLVTGGYAKPIDWIVAIVTFCSSAWLAWLGAFQPASIQVIGIVGVAFGFLGMGAALMQIAMFLRKPTEKMFWWYSHIRGFLASYIASWSAFSVVTLTHVLGNQWYVWLWPTIVGTPAIILTVAYYKRKFAPKSKTVAA